MVLWLVASLPFDIAAQTWFLIGRNGLSGEQRLQCRSKIFARHRNSVRGTAIVQLPAIDQFMIPIEQKKVRRAGSTIGRARIFL